MANAPLTATVRSSLLPHAKGEAEFDNLYSDAARYSAVQFWDERYASDPEPFEWYYGYDFFKDVIRENIPLDSKVLIAGCGSSNLPEDMVNDGYSDIVAADFSRVALAQLKVRCKHLPEITYSQGTLCDTDTPEDSYGGVVDKGLFDAICCGPANAIPQYVCEIERVLKTGSSFIIISHANPEDRLPLLEQYDIDEPYYTPWYIEVNAIRKFQIF